MVAATGAVLGAVGSLATIDQTIKGDEARRKQASALEKQQDEERTEIEEQKKVALDKRKSSIDLMRRQMLGAGDTQAAPVKPLATEVLG